MTRRFGDFIIGLLFGKQVGDTYEEIRSPTWRYQKRQNKLLAQGGLLLIGIAAACIWAASTWSLELGITVSFVFLASLIVHAHAAASDAIFDSLFERINLQSAWLDARLTEIERNTSKNGELIGQKRWEAYEEQMGEERHYAAYPDRYPRNAPWTDQSRTVDEARRN